jgi:hypothetical protein
MIKLLITATSFALGGAGIALVGLLSVNPGAFMHTVLAPPAAAHAPEAIPVAPPPETNAIVLAEVRITASLRGASKQKVLPLGLQPCSAWNEVGATFVDPSGATGLRQVRDLCTPPDER